MRVWQNFPGAPKRGTRLCRANQIADPGAKGFTFGSGTKRFDMFVIRFESDLMAFVNRCPHQGTPLDLIPDRFFDRSMSRLHCANHGAQFDVRTGAWVGGQYCDAGLSPVPIEVRNGHITIA